MNLKELSEVYALLGRYDLRNDAETGFIKSDIAEMFIHPDWNDSRDSLSYDADIAVLLLKQEITFNNFIQPICLPQSNTNVYNVRGVVAGYGRTESLSLPNKPKHVEILSKDLTCLFEEPVLARFGSPR
jgi:hypothetical protein